MSAGKAAGFPYYRGMTKDLEHHRLLDAEEEARLKLDALMRAKAAEHGVDIEAVPLPVTSTDEEILAAVEEYKLAQAASRTHETAKWR